MHDEPINTLAQAADGTGGRCIQDSLSRALLDVVLGLDHATKGRFVHDIRADVVLPQHGRNLQALREIAWLIRDDVDVASTRTPVAERLLLLEQGSQRSILVGCQSCCDLLEVDLECDCSTRVLLGLGRRVACDDVVISI